VTSPTQKSGYVLDTWVFLRMEWGVTDFQLCDFTRAALSLAILRDLGSLDCNCHVIAVSGHRNDSPDMKLDLRMSLKS
jgi:hypothetical protein